MIEQDEIRSRIEKILLDELTPKHQLFCNKYIENGYDTIKAYMEVYPTAKYNSARRNAFNILNIQACKEYITLQMRLLEPILNINKMMIIKELKNIIFDNNEKSHAKIKAIETLNKMMHYDSPISIEIKKENFDISNLSEDEKDQILKIAEKKL